MRRKIEYIVEIKTWFDRKNGNSYFSGRVTPTEAENPSTLEYPLVIPFQYGYGTHPEDVCLKAIQNFEGIHEINNDTYQRCYFIKNNALKREVVAFGNGE